MPELPEVHTVVEELKGKIIGKRIKNFAVRVPNYFYGIKGHLINKKITNVLRRAKIIIIELSDGHALLLHLKMSGQLFFLKKNQNKTRAGEGESVHTRVVFYFSDGSKLIFNDARRFGYVKLVSQKERETILSPLRLGPEPLTSDFNPKKLKEILKKRKNMRLKQLLLDQSMLAGVGNMYADEILYRSRISPLRRAGRVSKKETLELYLNTVTVLEDAIKARGTSLDKYRTTEGLKGEYGSQLLVYGREGLACPTQCGGVVKRIKLAGRSSYYCPRCQR